MFEKIRCDFETGKLYWIEKPNRRIKVGDEVGCLNAAGYLRFRYEGKDYSNHRVIWYFKYGMFPEKHLDHINGNILDNRISNLREVTDSQNKQNTHKAKGYCKRGDRYYVKVVLNNKIVYRKSFLDEKLAKQAYFNAKKIFHPFYMKESSN